MGTLHQADTALQAVAAIPASLPTVTTAAGSAVIAPVDLPITEQLVRDWLEDLQHRIARGQRSPVTHEIYTRAIRPWVAFLADEARTDAPSPATVLAFQEAGYQRGLQPATINLLVATVASLYRFAEREDRYPAIARSVERIREHRDGPLPCLTHEQILAIRASLSASIDAAAGASAAPAARNHLRILRRNRALLSVLYATGIRLVSVARADIGDVDLAGKQLRHQPKRHRAKDATAFLSPTAATDLEAYRGRLTKRTR